MEHFVTCSFSPLLIQSIKIMCQGIRVNRFAAAHGKQDTIDAILWGPFASSWHSAFFLPLQINLCGPCGRRIYATHCTTFPCESRGEKRPNGPTKARLTSPKRYRDSYSYQNLLS